MVERRIIDVKNIEYLYYTVYSRIKFRKKPATKRTQEKENRAGKDNQISR